MTISQTTAAPGTQGVDATEVARFSALAAEWWDADGPFKPLHRINPVRLAYIRDQICDRFGRDAKARTPLDGLTVADLGCGGGLVCEPLARLGASVTGADPSAESIGVARAHAGQSALAIDYREATAAELAREGAAFDIVLALEVVEHMDDVAGFVATCTGLVKPGGLMIVSTINRTLKAFALAIVGAEYVLRWVPAGTHDWEKFVTPSELSGAFTKAGLDVTGQRGLMFDPLGAGWRLAGDTDVNYFMSAAKDQLPTG